MKRIMFLLITVFMVGTLAMAQGNRRGEQRTQDPKARAERMTERMVKEYSLNDKQQKQLMELNLSMAEKMKDKPAVRHQKGKKDTKCECKNCDCKSKKQVSKDVQKKRSAKVDKSSVNSEIARGNMIKKRAEMKEFRESYNAKLKDIMSKEQYESYSKKQSERQQKMKERQDKKRS